MDTDHKQLAQVCESADTSPVKEDSWEKADGNESAISFAIEWANLGGD